MLLKKNFERELWQKFQRIVCWSVVRTFSFHSFLTSSTEIDGIVGNRGSCKATKGISEDELAGLHKVKVYLLVCCIKARFYSTLISFYMQVFSL
jgi:hypothetical protein